MYTSLNPPARKTTEPVVKSQLVGEIRTLLEGMAKADLLAVLYYTQTLKQTLKLNRNGSNRRVAQ